jgi:hypothetical protein
MHARLRRPSFGMEGTGDQQVRAKVAAQALQPRRLVHGGTDDGEIEPLRRPDIAVEYLALMQGDVGRKDPVRAGLGVQI